MLPIHDNSTISSLLMDQTCTKPFEDFVRSPACTKDKNSPRSRGNLERTSETAGEASVRQQAARKRCLYNLPQR